MVYRLTQCTFGSLQRLPPNRSQSAAEIAAQDAADLGVRISAADQSLGQIEHAFGVVEAFDIVLLPEGIGAFVIAMEGGTLGGGHGVVTEQIDIAAHAEELGAHQ